MDSLEEIALKAAKDAFIEIYRPSTTDPDPALVKWVGEFARRLVAALGAQKPVAWMNEFGTAYIGEKNKKGARKELQDWCSTPLFAAPVLPSVPEGWKSIETAPKDGAYVAILFRPYANKENQLYGGCATYINGEFIDDEGDPMHTPEYWKLLPAPPSPQEDAP